MNNSLAISKFITQLAVTVADGKLINASNDIEAMAIWLREYKDNANTLTSYRQCAERYYLWLHYHSKTLNTVTREDLQDYQDFLVNPQPHELWCGPRRPRGEDWKPFVKGLTTSSIRLQILILRNMYNYLVAAEYLTRNPFLLIKKLPKVINKGIDRVLVKKHIDYILEYIDQMLIERYAQEFDKEQALWLIKLFFLSGMRISEVSNGKMADFIYQRDQWWLRTVGKGNKERQIAVSEAMLDSLIRWRLFLGLTPLPSPADNSPLIPNLSK